MALMIPKGKEQANNSYELNNLARSIDFLGAKCSKSYLDNRQVFEVSGKFRMPSGVDKVYIELAHNISEMLPGQLNLHLIGKKDRLELTCSRLGFAALDRTFYKLAEVVLAHNKAARKAGLAFLDGLKNDSFEFGNEVVRSYLSDLSIRQSKDTLFSAHADFILEAEDKSKAKAMLTLERSSDKDTAHRPKYDLSISMQTPEGSRFYPQKIILGEQRAIKLVNSLAKLNERENTDFSQASIKRK